MTYMPRVRQEEHSTLQTLVQELERLEATRFDDVVDTRRMSFTTYAEPVSFTDPVLGEIVQEGPGPKRSYLTWDAPGHDEVAGGPVNDHAHGQIRERLGIPARYYDRMRGEAAELLDRNVQHWLSNPKDGRRDKRMVRMLEGEVRAFVSNRYRRLDNLPLMLNAVLPELARHEDKLVFHVAALTPERLYIRALLPGLEREVKVGDIVQAGVQIRNSEVGAGALTVDPFIWRLDCLNGMVSQIGRMSRYHVGREQEEHAYAMYRDDTLRADDAAFFLKVRDAVGAALSETQFDLIVRELREAATGERIADPVAATERLAKTYDLGEGEGQTILSYLAAGGDLSKWGMANAVTRFAKDADTFDRQAELELLGGDIATLPAEEWVKVAR